MKLRNLFTALQLESRHGAVTYRGSFAVEGCQYAESGLAPLPIQRSAIRVIEHSVYADHVEKRVIKWQRSEEHTSELQSLMRISYAVFCLKKNKYKKNNLIYIYKMKATQTSTSITI